MGFGIVGGGVIGPTHAKGIDAASGAKLVAVCDVVEEAAKKFAADFGVPAYTDLDQMLKRDDLDVLDVCTPSGLHTKLGIKGAEAGKHVLVEKPIDITLERADSLIGTCEKAGVKLAVIFQHRFDPATIQLKKAIDAGKFGKLILGDAYVKWYRTQDYYDKGGWRGTWEYDGGGSLINQSVHTIDLQRYFMGDPDWVFGKIGVMSHEIETEDLGLGIIEFKSGAKGVVEGSTSIFKGLPERLEIHGETGTGIIEGGKMKKLIIEGEEESEGEKVDLSAAADAASITASSHTLQIQDLVDAINEDRKPLVDGYEGRKALEVIIGIYRSSETGKIVKFPIK
ncbi:MAG: Gfo/Idh/MocA family oxidoreductase [Theionarchaea archaeon]|nr:Gfo/Idh/MocA family oxidoreductase [Theionarchaea archaeon]